MNQLIAFPLHKEKNPSYLTQRIKQLPIPEYFYTLLSKIFIFAS